MTYHPDMGRDAMVADGEHVRAIGWLHPAYPYTQGEVAAEFLSRLKGFVALARKSSEALLFGRLMGFHTCEFCDQVNGYHNFGVPDDGVLFVAPEMIVHYIEQHGYRPPDEFIAAVFKSPLPGTEEYERLTEPFRQLQRQRFRKMRDRSSD
jgi:hypothetical protein